MTTIKLSEAKAHLGRYAHQAAQGHQFIIADRNKPVAVIGPAPQPDIGIRPKIGLMSEKATIPDDFDAPLKSFENDLYGE